MKVVCVGALNVQGNGAGLVLISPENTILEYSLRFTFLSSNNVAEDEALIVSLAIARKLEIKRVMAYSDSQLVVQQFQDTYETRDPMLTQYLQKLRDLAHSFHDF